jgi:hypothetical protein
MLNQMILCWLNFQSAYKILFAALLKHPSFRSSGNVKPTPNDVVHAMPWQ